MDTKRTEMAKYLAFDVQHAEMMLTTRGYLMPLFVLRTDNVVVMEAPWRNEDEKVAYLQFLRLYCLANNVWGATILHEAWMTRIIAPEPIIPPSEAPDRMEIVIAVAICRDGDGKRYVTQRLHPIVRNAAGAVTGLDLDQSSDGEFAGRMVDILPDGPITPQQREAARELLGNIEIQPIPQ